MDFSISSRMDELCAEVRAFLQAEVYPLERGGFAASLPELEWLRGEVRGRSWWLPQIAAEHGGMGLSLQDYGLLSAELGRTPFGHYIFNCQAPDAGNMEILLQFGTPEQQRRFLQPLLAGRVRSCFGMTEPEHAGSNPVWMSTTARLDGDEWVIDGHKWFASGADGAAFCIVMAVTDPAADPHRRASIILVPTDTPGYQLVRNIPVMGEAGEGWPTHGELRFEGCRVPRENLLGEQGAGFTIAQERLGPGRIHHCMRWTGICERSFEIMVEHAARRELAPGVPLGSKELVQGWIAESRAEIDAARLLVLHAAWSIERHGAKAARDEISLIKFHVAGVLQRVIDRAIQTLGGLGMTEYTPLAHFYRHERAARIYDGPDEVHKAATAKRILRRAGAPPEALQ